VTTFSSRAFRAGVDLPRLVDFATELCTVRLPRVSYWDPGDIVWQLGGFAAATDFSQYVRIWGAGGSPVALAVFEPPLTFAYDLHPRFAEGGELAREVLSWAEHQRSALLHANAAAPIALAMLADRSLSVEILESDRGRIAFLEDSGYQRVERHSVRYRRQLDGPLPVPSLPRGMRLRHATDSDVEARAELHRDSWSVWGPSRFSASRYRRLRAEPVYEESLDVVVEDEAGRLLSYCIAWYDPVNRIGDFEPVGTRPSFTGRGLARAVVMEGLRRLQAIGAQTALIGTASVNAPALRCYAACGFELVERQHYYSKVLT
jgi:ribosomal protein S18 acetylase RimI-like enzyme